ncbi:hypothetical protein [Embleya sp. MST-111070]|uniref:hypothetical protein n=1 Tax=Embleya sp. MST-111070 TaxID=3398231 RepID=UPI003F737EEE
MTDPHGLTLVEQAAAVRARVVSPTELVDHHLRRIEESDEFIRMRKSPTPTAG